MTDFVIGGLQTIHPYSDSELAAALPSLRRLTFRARPNTCFLLRRWIRHEEAVDQTIKHYISFFPLVIFQSQARNAVASKFATTCGEPFQLFRTVHSLHVCPPWVPLSANPRGPTAWEYRRSLLLTSLLCSVRTTERLAPTKACGQVVTRSVHRNPSHSHGTFRPADSSLIVLNSAVVRFWQCLTLHPISKQRSKESTLYASSKSRRPSENLRESPNQPCLTILSSPVVLRTLHVGSNGERLGHLRRD